MVPLSLVMEATKQQKKKGFILQLDRCFCEKNDEIFLEYDLEHGKR